jgi:hypothetical protein
MPHDDLLPPPRTKALHERNALLERRLLSRNGIREPTRLHILKLTCPLRSRRRYVVQPLDKLRAHFHDRPMRGRKLMSHHLFDTVPRADRFRGIKRHFERVGLTR